MKEYYIIDNSKRQGSYSLLELKNMNISPDTHIWKDGYTEWKRASDIIEYPPIPPIPSSSENNSRKTPPPIPKKEKSKLEKIYELVEDTAGVDYKIAILLTSILLLLVFLGQDITISLLGNTLTCGLILVVWLYFKRYFDATEDRKTGKMILWIVGAYILHYFTYMLVFLTNWQEMGVKSIFEIVFKAIDHYFDKSVVLSSSSLEEIVFYINVITLLSLISFVGILISSIRVLLMDRSNKLPLIRIALSSLVMIPIWMLVRINEAFEKSIITNGFVDFLLMLPYIFLLIHFYRAETEDVTS